MDIAIQWNVPTGTPPGGTVLWETRLSIAKQPSNRKVNSSLQVCIRTSIPQLPARSEPPGLSHGWWPWQLPTFSSQPWKSWRRLSGKNSQLAQEPTPSLPNPENVAPAANRKRQSLRLQNPTDLDFEIDEDYLPEGFTRGDVCVSDKRHDICQWQTVGASWSGQELIYWWYFPCGQETVYTTTQHPCFRQVKVQHEASSVAVRYDVWEEGL